MANKHLRESAKENFARTITKPGEETRRALSKIPQEAKMNKAKMHEDDVLSFWRAQSELMWSRVQTASVIEAGTLAGWYKVLGDKHLVLAPAILGLGALLLVVVSLLMRRDSQYMDACETVAPNRIPEPNSAFLGLSGRKLAFALPLLLGICNLILVWRFWGT
jgi:hypothetical protein